MNSSVVTLRENYSVNRVYSKANSKADYSQRSLVKNNTQRTSAATLKPLYPKGVLEIAKLTQQQSRIMSHRSNTMKDFKKISQFRKEITRKIEDQSCKKLKKLDSNGVLPGFLNILRRESLCEVEINKRVSRFKRELFLAKSNFGIYDSKSNTERVLEKPELRRMVLDDLRGKITNESKKIVSLNKQEEVTIDELAKYVDWLSTEGKGKYRVTPLSSKAML